MTNNVKQLIINAQQLADDLLGRIATGQSNFDSVEDTLESIIDLLNEALTKKSGE